MCLVALSFEQHERFPLVLASNRDEFFDRPTAPLSWWRPRHDGPEVLAGRDLRAGGTWLGVTQQGRLALVTNVRKPGAAPGPSRGAIALQWLAGEASADAFDTWLRQQGFSAFNALVLDAREGSAHYLSSDASQAALSAGTAGLSNAALDTPWPKVQALKQRLVEALDMESSTDALVERLFTALSDDRPAEDEALPSTGVPLQWERWLSPAFIRTPDGRYGTRCSTVVVVERTAAGGATLRMVERRFTPEGRLEGETLERIADWPAG